MEKQDILTAISFLEQARTSDALDLVAAIGYSRGIAEAAAIKIFITAAMCRLIELRDPDTDVTNDIKDIFPDEDLRKQLSTIMANYMKGFLTDWHGMPVEEANKLFNSEP